MSGFPTELRPLLALVIVLAIAHMLLKARARRAGTRGPRPRRSRVRAARAARRGIDASIETRLSAAVSADAAPTAPADTGTTAPEAGRERVETDPAEALRQLRMRATVAGKPSDAAGS
ncbi:MAG: hypothetical protein LW806_09495 [Planctomycetaceae bacterium]|nr:hypothetical protein [Planctomycetaceae bacterium]